MIAGVNRFRVAIASLIVFAMLSGCSMLTGSYARNLGVDLGVAIKGHSDPATVEAALPSYLLLMDSMAIKSGATSETKLAAAHLYLIYASLFVDDAQRRKRLTGISLGYVTKSVCQYRQLYCAIRAKTYKQFEEVVNRVDKDDVKYLYELGLIWASWIKENSDNWTAVTQLAQVKRLLAKVIEIDETFDKGGPQLVLGIINTLVPPAMGGKPDLARSYFLKAIELSSDRNLSYKVAYAEHYARLVFDQELHDRLLREVNSEEQEYREYSLVNTIARRRAEKLLSSSRDYF